MKGTKTGRVKVVTFYASVRHHTPTWILKKIADLVDKATRQKDSSSILYACLEARNLLEMISTSKLLCSVSEEERDSVTAAVKPQHGIQGVNKELKALGLKTQEFINVVSAVNNKDFPVFIFSESDGIQHRLSQYIHTYAVPFDDMVFGSDYLKGGFAAINDAVLFAKSNLMYVPVRNTFAIGNIEVGTLPKWAKELLEKWKTGKIKDKEALAKAIKEDGEKYSAEKVLEQGE